MGNLKTSRDSLPVTGRRTSHIGHEHITSCIVGEGNGVGGSADDAHVDGNGHVRNSSTGNLVLASSSIHNLSLHRSASADGVGHLVNGGVSGQAGHCESDIGSLVHIAAISQRGASQRVIHGEGNGSTADVANIDLGGSASGCGKGQSHIVAAHGALDGDSVVIRIPSDCHVVRKVHRSGGQRVGIGHVVQTTDGVLELITDHNIRGNASCRSGSNSGIIYLEGNGTSSRGQSQGQRSLGLRSGHGHILVNTGD